MRLHVNTSCNVVAGSDSTSPRGTAQITIPSLRLRLYPADAERLVEDLTEAITMAREVQSGIDKDKAS